MSVMRPQMGKIKVGATEEETEECVQKVKGCKMGYLFENMEKMDIQAERRNTAQAKEELEKTRQELVAAHKEAESIKENIIQTLVETCQKLGATKDVAISKVMEKCGLGRSAASEKVESYWKKH